MKSSTKAEHGGPPNMHGGPPTACARPFVLDLQESSYDQFVAYCIFCKAAPFRQRSSVHFALGLGENRRARPPGLLAVGTLPAAEMPVMAGRCVTAGSRRR